MQDMCCERREMDQTEFAMTVDTSDVVIEIEAALDPVTRQLTLDLFTLDPETGWLPGDPRIGFLFPEDGTGRGQGSISYIVRPKAGLPTGTRIENWARIYFDYNDPIDTPVVFNTIDAGAPSSQVDPLPATVDSPDILVSWSGEDDPGGSGIESYDLYVSRDDGPFELWLARATDTYAVYPAIAGHHYAFYSLARDGVGHVEAAPEVADAVTYVTVPFDLEVTVDSLPGSIPLGHEFSYTVMVNNLGPGNATNVVLSHWIASGFTLAALPEPTQGSVEVDDGLITVRFGDLLDGDRAELQVPLRATAAGTFANLLLVTSDQRVQEMLEVVLEVSSVAPTLGLNFSADALTFTWPAGVGSFVLEETESLTPPIEWHPVTDPPVVVDDLNTLTMDTTEATRFYRLRAGP